MSAWHGGRDQPGPMQSEVRLCRFNRTLLLPMKSVQSYGKYHSTFRSQTGQVLAQLFEQNGRLVATSPFPPISSPKT